MPIVVTDAGERLVLDSALTENWTLKLFTNDYTPVASSVAASFTEATFTDYAAKTLTAATWGAAETVNGKATSTYPVQSWTCGETGNTIRGYFVVNASNVVIYAERLGVSRVLADGDILNLTPKLELYSAN